jgi:Cu-processing system permease protein
MNQVWIVAKTSLLENSRKQVFHVLLLLILTVIASSTLLSVLTEGVRLKILKDLCMTTILFGGSVLAIALGSTAIPNDLESRTIHPIIARPVARAQYVAGKFLGTVLTVSLGVSAMILAFAVLVFSYEKRLDGFMLIAMLFTILEVAVVAAVTTVVSTLASPAVTAIVSFLVYVFGSIKIGYFGGLVNSAPGFSKAIYGVIYHLLPNLECFNFKDALVHQDAVPTAYLAQVTIYGICYIVFALVAASAIFARREV